MNQMEIFKNPEFGSIRTFEQPYNVLLFQNLGLNAAVGKITGQIFQLLEQFALYTVYGLVPDFDVKLPFHHLAGEGEAAHLHDLMLQQLLLLDIRGSCEGGGQLRHQGRNIHWSGNRQKLKRVLAAGQAGRELLGDQTLFILAEQLRADGKYFQIR